MLGQEHKWDPTGKLSYMVTLLLMDMFEAHLHIDQNCKLYRVLISEILSYKIIFIMWIFDYLTPQ